MGRTARDRLNRSYLRKKLLIVSVLKDLGFSISFSRNFKCPFHQDRLASARCYEDTNTLYCFACARSWNSVQLYAGIKKISEQDAEAFLLKKYGLSKEAFSDDSFKDAVTDILSTKKFDLAEYRSKIGDQIAKFYVFSWKNIRDYALEVLDSCSERLYNDATKEEIDRCFKEKQSAFVYLRNLDIGISEMISDGPQ